MSAPIVGTTSLDKLKDLLGAYIVFRWWQMRYYNGLITQIGALDLQLSPEDIAYLEEPYKPMAVFGHE